METHPWNEIPLHDYESHMSDASVGQLSLLNSLTKKYLTLIRPASVIILGIAGGNGLEHIDTSLTKKVTGIDINQSYLDATFGRYHEKISSLELICLDLTKSTPALEKADMIWAALVMEYIGVKKSMAFSLRNLSPGGHLVVTIQSDHQLHSVSETGIESVKKVAGVFHPVDPDHLMREAETNGFILISTEENGLPNGKSFLTFHFKLSE